MKVHQALTLFVGGFIVTLAVPFLALTWWFGPEIGFFGTFILWGLGFLVVLHTES